MKPDLIVKDLMNHFHIPMTPNCNIRSGHRPGSFSIWTEITASEPSSSGAFSRMDVFGHIINMGPSHFLVRLHQSGSIRLISPSTFEGRREVGMTITPEEHLLDLITSKLAVSGKEWGPLAEVIKSGIDANLNHERSHGINWLDNGRLIDQGLRELSDRATDQLVQHVPPEWVMPLILNDLDQIAKEWGQK